MGGELEIAITLFTHHLSWLSKMQVISKTHSWSDIRTLFIDHLQTQQLKKTGGFSEESLFCLSLVQGGPDQWIYHQAAEDIIADLPTTLNSPKGHS